MSGQKNAHGRIADWAEEDRPREKFELHGAACLSNAELLAILIGSGNTDESAVALMRRVLHDCNDNLNTLGKMSLSGLTSYKGIGKAKAITILAACELGKRRQMEKAEEKPSLANADDLYEYMLPRMQDLTTEEAWVILMNNKCKIIDTVRISQGGFTETAVDVRVIIKKALERNATVIALCHNHPSNNKKPSAQDDKITGRVKDACETMRIFLMDHVIITDGEYYSYRDEGKL